jgi:hypothetical protein
MPQECSICRDDEREAIDKALLNGTPYRDIAGRCEVSKSAVARHRQHLSKTLVKARAAVEVAKADKLLERVLGLCRRAEDLLDRAEQDGLLDTALRAIREARGCLELLARLNGALRESSINIVSVELDGETAARMAATYLSRHRTLEEE